jgi:uncharacterized damage-inducible protein DinB
MAREFQELYAYNRWANARTLDAASAVPTEDLSREVISSFPSVLATLAHIVSGEWVWLSRWRGESPRDWPSFDLSTLPAVRARFDEVDAGLETFVGGLRERDLERKVPYKTMEGTPYNQSLAHMLRHVVNHSSYHRGQVTTLLRQLGGVPVSTDLIRFYRGLKA